MSAIEYNDQYAEQAVKEMEQIMKQNAENIDNTSFYPINSFNYSPGNNNTLSTPSPQLSESPLEPYLFEGEEFYYYYDNNNQITTPEEQAIFGTTYNGDNQLYNMSGQVLTWPAQIELQNQNNMNYLYNNIIENDNDNFNSLNPFMVQPSVYNDESTTLGSNLLLTQPLSEVTQNVIENQQFHSYDWCDLSSLPDTQQFIIDNNISTKIAEQNNYNNINIPSENQYTAWTDFQLLEA